MGSFKERFKTLKTGIEAKKGQRSALARGREEGAIEKIDLLDKEIDQMETELEALTGAVAVEETVEKICSLIAPIKAVLAEHREDICEIVRTILQQLIIIQIGCLEELKELDDLWAKNLVTKRQALLDAGFTAEEAFRILLATVKPSGFYDELGRMGQAAGSLKFRKQ